MDKGYQGAGEIVRAVIPNKKSKNGILTDEEESGNKKISSNGIMAENFLGECVGFGI